MIIIKKAFNFYFKRIVINLSSIEIEDLFLNELTKILEYFSLSFEIKLVETVPEENLAEQLESSIYKVLAINGDRTIINFNQIIQDYKLTNLYDKNLKECSGIIL
jgi:hypothetical protein